MFEKFGEFDSYGEINELAENLLNEGDTESLKVMAKENGIKEILWICICRERFRCCAIS